LVLQKNPNLDSEQIKKIIIETARKDNFTGAVPNREWGYGKIDPAAALKKVPISQAAAPKTPGAAK
ncbi:MAG TPA: hypothetical protein PKA41_19465, partial [Verrucomicrobiota bacterium]|nr:hypothetical protein [Verrucomicrobiota bacterium]